MRWGVKNIDGEIIFSGDSLRRANLRRANLEGVDRWWELEEENHPMARIRNINPAYGDPVEFADTTKMAMSIESCGYELSADGLKEGRDYEVIGGCSVVF